MSNTLRAVGLLTSSALLLATQTGCFTLIKQAFYEVRGAKSDIRQNTTTTRAELQPYEHIEFAPVTTELTDQICPRRLLFHYDEFAANQQPDFYLAFPGDPPALSGHSEILYYAPKGILGAAIMITRFRLYDGEREVGDLVVITESKSFRAGDEDDMARSAAHGLGKYLAELKLGTSEEREAEEAEGEPQPAPAAPETEVPAAADDGDTDPPAGRPAE